MEGCDSPVISGKDNGCGIPQHQQWTELNSTHLPDKPSSMEQSTTENHGALDSLRVPFNERIPDSANSAGPNTESTSKEVRCNECLASFASLQTYMEHHCPSAHPPLPLREESGSDTSEEGDEESDVENLAGEIVYQPDGSAYIVENVNQLIQSGGACGSGSGALPSFIMNSLPNAGGKQGEPSSAAPVYPQIINTFHIASSFGKWFEGSDQSFPNTSALTGISPVLHSFRVFDVRHKSNKDYLNSDGSAKSSCVSKDVPNNVDLSKFDGFVLYGKRKPILMCFLCKLSFGYVRSFVTHAVHDHRVTLSEEERRILSNKNISAIIQGIGKDKEPLVSFLEPKNKNFQHPLVSAANLIGPGHSFYGKFSGIRMEGEEALQTGTASGAEQPPSGILTPGALLNLGGLTSSALKTPITSVPPDPLASSPTKSSEGKDTGAADSEKQEMDDQDSLSEKAEPTEEGEGEEEEEVEEEEEEEEDDDDEGCKGLFPSELEDELEDRPHEESGAVAGSSSKKDPGLSNQSISISPLMPNLLQTLSRGTASSSSNSASSFVFDGANRRNRLSFNNEGSGASMAEGSRRLDFIDESANKDNATAPEPNESAEGEDGSYLSHHQHAGPLCELGGGECPSGSGVECPKCDTVLGSSRSLGGHMTMMHSRNSCKTLKCPKCNWHYKYQQTLEAHMKEKHPEPGGSCVYCKSGQPHPRLARGESYTCGYKPFRCEVCNYSTTTKGNLSIHMQSDKHLNNMQNLQNGGGEQVFSHTAGAAAAAAAVAAAAAANIGSTCGAPSPTKPKTKPTWRCEVCDYETNVARNLRIHMTSEKHMHNMMLLQQNMTQIQHNRHLGLGSLPSPAEAELYQYYLAQNMNLPNLKMDSTSSDAQFMMGGYQLDPTSPMATMAPSLVGGEIPLDMRLGGGQLVSEELMNLGESFTQTNDPSLKLFQCAVCNKFTTDNLDMLGLHMNVERSLPEDEWKAVMGDSYQCKLCRYNTQLKANFQLHCKTDKHVQKYQLVAHIKEGGKANEWRLKCVAIGNPVHLKCNACDYYTNSLEKLRLHTVNSRHEASLKLYKHLQHHESGVEGESCYYHCALCNYSTKAKLNLIQHVRSMKHQRSESLRKLQHLQKGLPEEEEDLGQIFTIRKCPAADAAPASQADKELTESPASSKRMSFPSSSESHLSSKWSKTSEETKSEQMYQCPYCKYSNTDVNRLRVHAMTQHSVQPMLRCPLCQDMLNNKIHLQLHLTHLHSVSPDCVEKLIMTVTTPEVMMPSSMFLPAATPDRDGNTNAEEPGKQAETSEDSGKSVLSSESVEHSGESRLVPADQSTTREDSGFLCWKKGCSQVFKTSSALQTHFNEVHAKRPQLPVSDRHVYKYRCNQCSLAFKTIEKLQLHSQYHVIRAATMCCLCQRSFRTFQALKKHLETSHLELSEADIQQLYSGLLVNGDLLAMGDPSLADDHTIIVEDDKEEESDLEDKQSPTGSDSGSVQEDLEPKRALPFRKGPNFTMEKFLDPSRPYKCTVCKESFTQKNILLVHYNSVSHLHKLKRALQESATGQPEPTSSPDNKPFKCNTCNVAYSQSSTLEIHMRSVLHQTKARAAKLEAASGSGNSNGTGNSSSSSISLGSSTPSPVSTSSSNTFTTTNTSNASTATVPSLLSQGSSESVGIPPSSNPISTNIASPSEPKDVNRKKLADMIASRQQQQQQAQTLAQAQAQVQAHLQQELQQQAALLQSQLFNPALLPHFPMTTETLLQLQQQQHLLFPFYIPSAEFQLNPEVSLPVTSGALTLSGTGPNLLEDLKAQVQLPQQSHTQILQQQQGQLSLSQSHSVHIQQSQHQEKKNKSVIKEKEKDTQRERENAERGDNSSLSKESLPDNLKPKDKKDFAPGNSSEPSLLPPRIASDARGNATKALLENFGFELVIQYNENKQKVQKKSGKTEQGENLEKLECDTCGKFFSNILILKSHQEHVHQHYFPFKQLERFAKQYREHYDKLYPLRPQTPDPPPPPPPPPPPLPTAPPQPASTPAIPTSAPPITSPTIAPTQPSVPLTQLSMPMELPIFSPLMMQTMPLQTLPAQLPPQLGPVDPLPADLAQLYQHQLNPSLLQQQQNKRPRTRITDDQLRVLRQYFDINNSPSEEQIKEMADKSGLPQKVIKHWFRNTLFKERQRNKDSPYNFSNPPITSLEELKIDSRPPSPEPQKHEYWGSKRSSRTRFTDYQLRVLQDFFDANAYPKDDEFEQLSNLLNLPTRVIVVWFQNARQKARKNYENQGEGKDGERRELTNDRYIRTSNLNYQCKKCSLVFQRIFDLIKHQKKLCYKDEDEDGQDDSQNEDSMDAMELLTPTSSSCSTPMPSQAYSTPTSSANATSSAFVQLTADADDSSMYSSKIEATDEKPKQSEPLSTQQNQTQDKQVQPKQEPQQQQQQQDQGEQKTSSAHQKISPLSSPSSLQQQPPPQAQPSQCPLPQSSPSPSQLSHLSLKPLHTSTPQQLANLPPQLIPYQCEQCKLAFPSFEHWQEHQQLHFLSAQNQFIHPQFLDRTLDMPFMLFDPSNPLLASQLLSGTLPQIPASTATSPSIPTSTMNTLKRKLEEKASASPGENDSGTGGEEPQRDKRLRTTITPEQLEILYQKYLLDSNPTRKMLDHIAHEVGLKKRVVQVWFQNTRARERKGQFRAVGPAQAHRRCPFCRALFKAKTALEAHIRSRHWHEAKRAGYNLTLSAMLLDCDGGLQMKGDIFDGASFSHLPPTSSDGQGIPLSPASKTMELSPRTLLSPSSIKVEGIEDFESPSISSVNLSFDQTKLDNDDCSSVNTAITDTTTGDEGNADNDSATGIVTELKSTSGPSEGLTKAAMIAMSEYEDRLSSGLVSPAPSFYSKEYDNEGTVDYSETSSLADPCSPSPGASGSAGKSGDSGDRPGQKRFRTQMTNLQLKVLKSCFNDYRTPTMLECEVLGNDIGLPKRVVQVWFQNARAKEKKSKLSMAKHFGINQTSYEGPKTECTLCGIKYSARLSVRDHIFSQQHISKVKDTIGSQLDKEKEYFDPATVRQLMAQQELDRIKKANEVLGLAAQQQGMFDNAPLQALNLPTAYPALQGIPPVLLPGLNSPSLPGFTPSNTALTSPKPNLMGLPSTSVPSPGLPTSGLPNKQPSASLSSPTPAQATVALAPQQQQQQRKDKESEKIKEKEKAPKGKGDSLPGPKKEKGEAPAATLSAPLPTMEYAVEPAQLQALQAALNSDPTALLTSQFLPYFVPGFSPYYAPQIPGALQSGYLQPMYGMEGLFPYSPALSQALLGLSPSSLLQQYQQYQQSLQEALQQQQRQVQQQQQKVQQQQQPKGSQTPVPPGAATPDKDPAKESPKQEEQKNAPCEVSPVLPKPQEEPEAESKSADSLCDPFIVPKVQYKLVCRKCQAGFSDQEAASNHLKSLCFFGQSVVNLQEMVLHVPTGSSGKGSSSYQCVACESTVCGDEALSQHLESAPHKHRTITRAARNAKEHPSLLPHSACLPDPSTASTSQSAAHSNDSPQAPLSSSSSSASPHASRKSWPQVVSRAPLGKLPPPSFPPLSSSSTVTSSSCSTSGVQPSMPTDDYSEESDTDLSQKSDGPASPGEGPKDPSCPKDSGLTSVGMDTFRL
ncbi:zinc finger homeobox protein 3 isoform X2 [Chelonoidis abingdonii]|uniref:zinc finger homeobox protein 3 isoform X2 n=1 Tax=Chelonoidis abingdonii TaxID=106734 RepID=UPI0013F1B54A|nr:zinc finger homeobox protein 3 isoform X2 [Chelonoidis abingdonii]